MTKEYERYSCLSDEELIDRQKDGDDNIVEYLCDKYKNLVRSKAKSMFILGADREDLIQEGMIGLFKAVRDFDSGRDASFYTFAELCISRQMYTAVQASRRQKHIPLNTYISLYSQEDNQSADALLLEASEGCLESSPEEAFIHKETIEALEKMIEEQLSDFENQVLDLYVTGMPTTQIARVLGRDEKSTDNALQRLRGKMRRLARRNKNIL